MNRKQKIFVIITALIVLALFSGIIFQAYQIEHEDDDRIKIVATFYPLAFFSERIGGEHVSVTTLIPHNTEVHAWQPSVADIVATDEADILLYNGVELDHWFEEDILPVIDKDDKLIIETTDNIELLISEEEEEEEGEHEEEDEHGHGLEDPHTWISPFIAGLQAERIYEAIVQVDPLNEVYYTERWLELESNLRGIDENFTVELSNKTKEGIFTTHAAFGYLAERYEFEQYGVIGISADEQPSTSTISNLVELMLEHDSFVIYIDPVYVDDYAQTLKRELESETGEKVTVLKLYYMLGPLDGLDYLEQHEMNLKNLRKGLGVE
jgi:zinc transport system substrate-binding protein